MILRFPRLSREGGFFPNRNSLSSSFYSATEDNGREKKRWHLCNSILRASLEKGSPRNALVHFRTLILPGAFRPDHRTLSLVLEACRTSSNLRTATCAHAMITKSGLHTHLAMTTSLFHFYLDHPDSTSYAHQLFDEMPVKAAEPTFANLLIAAYLKIGDLRKAREVFDEMPLRDLVSWNSIIGGCAKLARPKEAVDLFRRMLAAGFEPDQFTFSVTLSACAKVGARDYGDLVHSLMLEKKVHLNHILTAALIDMLAKCGKIEKAKEVFCMLPRKDASIWNSMLSGLAIHGLGGDAIDVFSRMEEEGVLPDSITFVGLLTACAHSGLVQEGRHYFVLMKEKYHAEPSIEHYGAFVDLLARAGHLQEAYETIKAMPMMPDIVVWRSLLSGSRIYRQPNMAEIAVSEMKGHESGDFVLLSSVYSQFDRWSCAERVWEEMKCKRIRKVSGLSWVEIHGRVHEFKAGDRSHAESDQIHRLLNELTKRVKEIGFTHVTGSVAVDVLEEEKEENLNGHSEKLAVAYGILKSAPESEIRVSKNLRACIDCHSWLKAVSGLLCRVIIVRDRVRFHRFDRGSCSCNDYW